MQPRAVARSSASSSRARPTPRPWWEGRTATFSRTQARPTRRRRARRSPRGRRPGRRASRRAPRRPRGSRRPGARALPAHPRQVGRVRRRRDALQSPGRGAPRGPAGARSSRDCRVPRPTRPKLVSDPGVPSADVASEGVRCDALVCGFSGTHPVEIWRPAHVDVQVGSGGSRTGASRCSRSAPAVGQDDRSRCPARRRHVRRHLRLPAGHGARPQPRHPVLGPLHDPVPADRAEPGAQLPRHQRLVRGRRRGDPRRQGGDSADVTGAILVGGLVLAASACSCTSPAPR